MAYALFSIWFSLEEIMKSVKWIVLGVGLSLALTGCGKGSSSSAPSAAVPQTTEQQYDNLLAWAQSALPPTRTSVTSSCMWSARIYSGLSDEGVACQLGIKYLACADGASDIKFEMADVAKASVESETKMFAYTGVPHTHISNTIDRDRVHEMFERRKHYGYESGLQEFRFDGQMIYIGEGTPVTQPHHRLNTESAAIKFSNVTRIRVSGSSVQEAILQNNGERQLRCHF
jgi:hypothetical protein